MSRPLRGKTSQSTVLTARYLRHPMTESEQTLWEVLRDSRMQGNKFRRQHPFGPYILDFFCVQAQLAIELDGGIHDQPDQKEYDQERTAYLESQGLRVLRFRNDEVANNLERVISKIIEAASPIPRPLPSPDVVRQEREGVPQAGKGEEKEPS
jgi:very-short-patch-repair endonuclease